MNVVIVAKTRQGRGACVGGIAADGRSVRLIAADAAFNEQFNLDFHVGEEWEIEGSRPRDLIPPHVENVVVRRKKRLRVLPPDELVHLIKTHMPPRIGGPEALYEGMLRVAPSGALHVAQEDVPAYSTTFWRPDQPLQLDTTGKRLHYRYPSAGGGRTLTFVGFQEPLETIPAGTLLRVSLAHWWRPDDRPDDPLRCYAQLSGWFEEIAPQVNLQSPISQSRMSNSTSPLSTATETLKRVFGYDEFRPLQAEIIANVLAGRDCLAVMPTGSGKSLCYQLPALLFPGLTVVVSPLISLMEDQVMQLRELGVPAAYLNSSLTYDAYLGVMHGVANGQVKLLYAAPETLLRPEILTMLGRVRVDCLTIDEAHCISEWGHDFRPEYRQLIEVRRRLPDAVCLAVTATATERVRGDIGRALEMTGAAVFVSSFDRPNLHLAVEARRNGPSQALEFLDAHRGQSGIIYCMTRKGVDTLTAHLNKAGWNALPYHAGLDTATRQRHQRRFTYDEAPIIVATVAFGMGINKSNVRFILHYDLPKDLESYYQQIGRAGRDGLRADCLLLHSPQDAFTITQLIDQGDPGQRPGAMARFQAMRGYAESDQCRRRPLLAYFGEQAAERCGHCDNCAHDDRDQVDLTVPAQKFLSCVKRTGEVFGASHIIDVLRGSKAAGVLTRGHDKLSTYNIGRELSKDAWQQLARQFVQKGLLEQDMTYGGLSLTQRGWAVLRGEAFFGAPPVAQRPARHEAGPADYDVDLFEQLRDLRRRLAEETGVPPYVVFHDASLADMARHYPQSPATLNQMHGVGAVKLERYGAAVLAVIRAYCAERGIAEQPKATPDYAHRPSPIATRRDEVVALYQAGHGVRDIAETFGVKPATVIDHLWNAVREDGLDLDGARLPAESALAPKDQNRVLAQFKALGADRLRPIFDALGETVSFEELHLLRLYYVTDALKRKEIGD